MAGELLLREFSANCCVNGTWIAVQVFKMFDVDLRPVVVELLVFNKTWWQKMEANNSTWPDIPTGKAWQDEGAWCLAAGGGDDETGWGHHLVAVGSGMIVDSALGQASRPQRDIELKQVAVFPVPPDSAAWWRGDVGAIYENRNGSVVSYRPQLGIKYDHIAGFSASEHNLRMAARVGEAMYHRLRKD